MTTRSASNPDLELAIRAGRDLQKRIASGIFIYPILWLLIGFGSGLNRSQLMFFLAVALVFVAFTLIRLWQLRSLPAIGANDSDQALIKWNQRLMILLLPHSLGWGLLYAYSLVQSNTTFLLYMTFSSAGIIPGGINNFAPNVRIARLFVLTMLVPSLVVTIFFTRQWPMTTLLAVYVVFVMEMARRQALDYEHSIENEWLLSQQSRTDALTQLDNRRYFDEKLNELCHLTSRSHDKLTVVLVDCDHFKSINDRHGHDVGDECLKHLAHILSEALPRTTDVCARFGGEEFSLILPGTDLDGARIVGERLREKVAASPLQIDELTIAMTVSIGTASCIVQRFDPDLPAQFFKLADKALYQAKAEGRNRCVHLLLPNA